MRILPLIAVLGLASTMTYAQAHQGSQVTRHRIGGKTIVRVTPVVDNIAVEGADRITAHAKEFTESQLDDTSVEVQGTFQLSRAQAVMRAHQKTKGSLLIDPLVERLTHFSKKVWLQTRGAIRPAYRVRIPTLLPEDLYDTWIDAENGRILKMEPALHFADVPAKVFKFSPPPSGADRAHLVDVTLPNLLSDAPGSYLQGDAIALHNCCRYYTADMQTCAQAQDPGAVESQKTFQIAKSLFGITDSSVPELLYLKTPICARLPLAASSAAGFDAEPIDGLNVEAELDAFSEQQAYFLIEHALSTLRQDTQNAGFCPRHMNCDANGKAQDPFHVYTNQQLPDFMLSKDDANNPDGFVNQLAQGRGDTPTNPIVLKRLKRVGNAAFVSGTNRDQAAPDEGLDEIVGELIKPFGYLIIFQGNRDFAYDGDVMFHEFTHAAVDKLVPGLGTFTADKWGIVVETGALNEGYADYIAASLTNSPQIGEYSASDDEDASQYLRSVDNANSCPRDVQGEIHDDSSMWSGALWELQKAVVEQHGPDAVSAFRGVLYAAIAQANDNETFTDQSSRVIDGLSTHPLFNSGVAQSAQSIFASRGLVGCERVVALDGPKAKLNLVSPKYFGFENYAPAPMQFKITTTGAKSFDIAWKQFFASRNFINAPIKRDDVEPLRVIVSDNGPIEWDYTQTKAVPTLAGETLDFNAQNKANMARYENDQWHFTHQIAAGDACETKTFYISILTLDNDYRLENITPTIDTGNTDTSQCAAASVKGCACDSSHGTAQNPWLGLLLIVLVLAYGAWRAFAVKVLPLRER